MTTKTATNALRAAFKMFVERNEFGLCFSRCRKKQVCASLGRYPGCPKESVFEFFVRTWMIKPQLLSFSLKQQRYPI
jgi:hypothetical protein